jgi:hypothetical protein
MLRIHFTEMMMQWEDLRLETQELEMQSLKTRQFAQDSDCTSSESEQRKKASGGQLSSAPTLPTLIRP